MLAKSHPYGNEGLHNRIHYTGYDPEAIEKGFRKAIQKFDAMLEDPPEDLRNTWMVIMSADIIQWDNNLFNIFPIIERSTRRTLVDDSVYAIETKNESLVAIGTNGEEKEILLTFEKEQQASSFESHLIADGQIANKLKISIDVVKRMCKDKGMQFGIVPERTLVALMQFERAAK